MDLMTAWLYPLGLVWAVLAYSGAALCAFHLFDRLKTPAPPRPFCTVAAATRWMLRLQERGRSITAADKLRLASLLVMLAAAIFVALAAIDLMRMPWPPLKPPGDLVRLLGHGALGSGLIIALSGAGKQLEERGSQ